LVKALFSSVHTAVLALCVGLAVLCTLTRPVFTTVQELHELAHDVSAAGSVADADDAKGSDPALEGVFHAPHCCVHAGVLPPTLLFSPSQVTQAPPHFVAAAPCASPLSRFLRPPIFA
jgi:hypothetical protein